MKESVYEPEADIWYRDLDGNFFKVTTVEDDGASIEIQDYDGTVDELDARTWRERRPQPSEPAEDWSASMDVSREDYRVDNDLPSPPEDDDPLDRL